MQQSYFGGTAMATRVDDRRPAAWQMLLQQKTRSRPKAVCDEQLKFSAHVNRQAV